VSFRDWIEMVGVIVDIGGVVVIVLGILVSLGAFAIALSRSTLFPDAYRTLRHSLGRAILLGLELLVAADIVRTVAVEPTLTSVAVLALIVLVRTFLSFSLEVELEGRWPWQRASAPDRS
jgi:uncharacterized membrane protein